MFLQNDMASGVSEVMIRVTDGLLEDFGVVRVLVTDAPEFEIPGDSLVHPEHLSWMFPQGGPASTWLELADADTLGQEMLLQVCRFLP